MACLILKVMLEDILRHGKKLAEELRDAGAKIKAAAEKELTDFYPPDKDGSIPIAYSWAPTVRCEAPKCGAEIPLVCSFWLSKKASHRWALRYRVVRPHGKPSCLEFETFEPEKESDSRASRYCRPAASSLKITTASKNAPPIRRPLLSKRTSAPPR